MATQTLARLRRGLVVGAVGAAAAIGGISGCARNPVTGKTELALISEQQEIQMGQQAAQEVAQTIGLVDDQALQDYVQRIGVSMASKSERPNLPWTFRVVDDPTPNAFALPGGFIFVTRGLMNLMTDEAQLATVVGHEIGHVTARHTVQQLSQQQLAQLGLGIGMILVPQLQQFGQLLGSGLSLLFLKYSRDDERQADQLGFRYALSAHYDPRGMVQTFRTLERVEQASGQSPLPSWASSHPLTPERIQTAEQRLASLQNVNFDTLTVDRAQYLSQLDGLVYGDDPRQGFFQNGVFYHPQLRFHIAFPRGWKTQNTPQAVVAVSPQQDAAIQLTLASQAGASQAAQAFFSQQGLQAGQVGQQSVNGLPAVVGTFQAQTDQGVVQGLAVFLDYGGHTYQLLGYSPAQSYGAYDAAFRQSIGSFGPESNPQVLSVQPNRVQIVRTTQAMTLAQFNQRYPSVIGLDELAIINQLPDANSTIPAGTGVKRVVKG